MGPLDERRLDSVALRRSYATITNPQLNYMRTWAIDPSMEWTRMDTRCTQYRGTFYYSMDTAGLGAEADANDQNAAETSQSQKST